MAQCKDILNLLDELAPFSTAEPWDNTGLLTGSRQQEVTTILTAMDLTQAVAEEAAAVGAQMILLHHPILFSGAKKITDETEEGRMLIRLIRHGICVVAMHTNWDKAKDGVNDSLAKLLELCDTEPLMESAGSLVTLSTYVPDENAAAVSAAVCAAGAGRIGNYGDCVFATHGEGSFKPLAGAHPAIGNIGETEHIRETKLEWIVEKSCVKSAVAALLQAHPYEEPVYTLVSLLNDAKRSLGCIGRLKKPMRFEELCDDLCDKMQTVVRACGNETAMVSRVAVCGGSGGMQSVLDAIAKQADALVTSDLKHHDLLFAAENGLCVADPFHGPGEMPGIDSLIAALQKRLNDVQYNVNVIKATTVSGFRFYGRTFVR